MAPRLRHCVECPECHTRYLIGFSPYRNGSSLAIIATESSEEYQLSCSCSRPPVPSRCTRNQLKLYAVPNRAFNRGYGPPSEIPFVPDEAKAFSDLIPDSRRNADETDGDKA